MSHEPPADPGTPVDPSTPADAGTPVDPGTPGGPGGLRDAGPGTVLPTRTFRITRADLVRYAGASGDFNPIHWSERVATSVGLPGVIAHGMLTMALAGRAITDWAGDPGTVAEYGVRFAKPVVVPDDAGAEVTVEGVVKRVLDDGRVQVELTVRSAGEKVLSQARAVLRKPAPGTRLG